MRSGWIQICSRCVGSVGEAMKQINKGFLIGSAISVVGFIILARREKEMFATESAEDQHDSPDQPNDTVTRSEEGRWIVPIGARLEGPGGQFEGVVSSAIIRFA